MKILSLLILTGLFLVGCNSDSNTDEPSERSLSAYLEEVGHYTGYLKTDTHEFFYGYNTLAFRAAGDNWKIETFPESHILSAVAFTADHWLLSGSFINNEDKTELNSLLETKNGGLTWQGRSIIAEKRKVNVSAMYYDYTPDRLYAAIDKQLGYSDNRGESFEHIELGSVYSTSANQLIKHPTRNELWWIGQQTRVSGTASHDTSNTTDVRLYKLDSPVSVKNMSATIGLHNSLAGLIHANAADTIFIAGDNGIAHTENNGNVWEHLLDNQHVTNVLQSASADTLYAAFQDKGKTYVACSQDNGNNMQMNIVSNPIDGALLTLFASNGNALLFAFENTGIYQLSPELLQCN